MNFLLLNDALMEIKATLLSNGNGPNIQPDEDIKKILDCCNDFFLDMHDAYSSDDSRCLQELHEEALKAIYSAGFDIQSNNPENIEKAPNIDNGLEAVFPPFSYSDFPLENILSTKQQSAMTILPYLLSSYYISLHRRQKLGSSPELEIFPRTDNIPLLKGDHFSRNLNVFLSRFSSRGFLFRLGLV